VQCQKQIDANRDEFSYTIKNENLTEPNMGMCDLGKGKVRLVDLLKLVLSLIRSSEMIQNV